MEFRKAIEEDSSSIMNIIKQAQAYFKKKGINQWQNNYPNLETIRMDIKNNNGYVLLKDNKIIGTTAFILEGEKTYENIYEGEWLSSNKYGTIHRIAIDSQYKGIGTAPIIIKNLEEICLSKGINSIRVDTHEENLSMQRLVEKNGFKYCGIIYLEDKSKRMAFEKILL
ncbi:acetyltransferase (GNAT) family protein [Clostridium homopropionicum DSM 5847]|uniref:Acetyltransferase (GNAT) family protein n=1 Tax=Clostridium homopropionicum DSM 5847 TaxID=1121318 RepID=A0A0L6Z646_9CLOT|nr:GNAT family N-acetyltransferase [Clostridium homopropionicum]KOA18442.1 acetyltransferase (GNAT) family protein [Clostridium homopropionicum DSM 5847]SFF66748.1 Acetyltransferase (GNAT) domain-containing protein [Clostridium homopropionicum]